MASTKRVLLALLVVALVWLAYMMGKSSSMPTAGSDSLPRQSPDRQGLEDAHPPPSVLGIPARPAPKPEGEAAKPKAAVPLSQKQKTKTKNPLPAAPVPTVFLPPEPEVPTEEANKPQAPQVPKLPAPEPHKPAPAGKKSKLFKVPTPVGRNAHKYQSDGNDGCWKGGPRDFLKRPVVVYQQGSSGDLTQPPFDMCDVPCFSTGNGALVDRADVFPAWEGLAGTGRCTEYQKTSWVTMENYEQRSPPGASYRSTVSLQSEVPVPYFSWFDFEPMKPMMRVNKTGTAMATAFVSNCGASERRSFIEALMSHGITVHSFGGCLHNKDENEVSSVAGKYERKMDIMSKYMFHLSFENSRTRDYVTEKFFQSLEAGVVPVYFGAPNIEDFEPAPNSILHIDDFSGPEAVAAEMKRLANDRAAYMKMLEWKTTGLSDKFKALFDLNAVHSVCRLCLRTADDFAKQFGEVNGGVAPEHLSVPRDDFFHVLVRERNAFYFYVVPLDEDDLTIAGLHGAILQAFEGYVPIFARHEKLVKLRNYKGKYGVHRVYPPYISVYDTMYGPQALKADADVAALKKGDKLEVIFLETRD